MARRRNGNGPRRMVYRWHRRLGLTAALFVLFLAATGIALNHTDRLGLDERFVSGSMLQDWYGLGVPDAATSATTGDHVVTLLGDTLYLDAVRLDGQYSTLTGAVGVSDQIYVAVDGDLLVVLQDGRLVERLGPVNGLPRGIGAIGVTPDVSLVVRTDDQILTADPLVSEWRVGLDAGAIQWSVAASAPPALVAGLRDRYRDRMLSLERVMLDLHSGRIFGRAGPLVMDAVAVLFIVLAMSGFWMWLRRPPHAAPPGRRYEHARYQNSDSRNGGSRNDGSSAK